MLGRLSRPRFTRPTKVIPLHCRNADGRRGKPGIARRPADDGKPGRAGDGQGVSLARGTEGTRCERLEDTRRREEEPRLPALARDDAAGRAGYNNRVRLLSGVARAAFKLRAALCERSFALVLDRGGMSRAWLRGQENLHKALSTARRRLQSWPVDAADDRRRHRARAADRLPAFISCRNPRGWQLIVITIIADRTNVLAAVVLDLSLSPD